MFSALFRFQTKNTAINISSLILRLGFGLMMMPHGFSKLERYEKIAPNFLDFFGLGGPLSLGLAIFAEFFCAMFVALWLMTRLTIVPLNITMLVAAFIAHAGDPFGEKEHSLLFLTGYLVILILGPGKFSIDALFQKNQLT